MYYWECEHYLVYLGCDFLKKIDVESVQRRGLKISERKMQGYANVTRIQSHVVYGQKLN